MTTLMVNVKDEKKVDDVFRFLRDIEFLDVFVANQQVASKGGRKPASILKETKIVGNIVESIVSEADWEVLRETVA